VQLVKQATESRPPETPMRQLCSGENPAFISRSIGAEVSSQRLWNHDRTVCLLIGFRERDKEPGQSVPEPFSV